MALRVVGAAILVQILLLVLLPRPFMAFASVLVPMMVVLGSTTDFETYAADLSKKGVKATAPASIVGRSGVKHDFAFAVAEDSGKTKVVVDTELSVKEVDEMKVLKFYVKVYDVAPEKAILCVSPKLSSRAATLAREYGLSVLEEEVPRKLIQRAADAVDGFTESVVK